MTSTTTQNGPAIIKGTETYQRVGRVLGPIVFVLMLVADQWQSTMSTEAWRVAAIGLWMAIWWATEAIPVFVTAFLPIIAFDPLGVATISEAAGRYADPIIFLYLGGFILALALEKWNLHKRIALAILDRTGTDGRRLIGGFMLVCALLSMWMTNTSTTMMLLPIVLSVSTVIVENAGSLSEREKSHFRIAMLLGLAYAASIGGLATLIGTPPNGLLVGFMADNYGIEISFARWMIVGIPITAIMLPLAWLVLTRIVFKVNIPASAAVQKHLHEMRLALGLISIPEKRVAIVFAALISSWMMLAPLLKWAGLGGFSDAAIAMTAAVVLFLLPSGDRQRPQLMTWEDTLRLPWGVLILFGGGLSLAAAVKNSGLALWLGEGLAPLNVFGVVVLVIAAVTLVIFLTELTSNLATAATLLPVVGAIAFQVGVPPIVLTVPITIAASCAFMLPVATPPNAIVFATGAISIPDMVKAGFVLNILGIVMVTLISLIVAPWLLS